MGPVRSISRVESMTTEARPDFSRRRWAGILARLTSAVSACAASGTIVYATAVAPASAAARPYPWWGEHGAVPPVPLRLDHRIAPPAGFIRMPRTENAFGSWLRGLPVKPGTPPVLLYDGSRKSNQYAHVAVLDIDVGPRDLQQCADAVMRLRAEYLFASGHAGDIAFHLTSGDRVDFARWRLGDRPIVTDSGIAWKRTALFDDSYRSLRSYLDVVFTYAGTFSLGRALAPLRDLSGMRPGDVFVDGGFPGHAAIVLDMAVQPATGRTVFLLAQSYMPAQEIHVLRNPADPALSPWYPVDAAQHQLVTPEWTFQRSHLRTWLP